MMVSANTSENDIDTTRCFEPHFDNNGLLICVAVDYQSRDVLMVAYMNEQALAKTIATGKVHYWSRSRRELWLKGETSGNSQRLVELRLDCDQDALLAIVETAGPACHTGRHSCFYRRLTSDNKTLEFITT